MKATMNESRSDQSIKTLLVLNYVMSESHPVFGHQIGIVSDLSEFFHDVIVITSKRGDGALPSNVRVLETHWGSQSLPLSVFRFLKLAINVIRTTPNLVVFSHMTEVQSAILAPVTRLLRIKHFLWYAHTSKSSYLVWCHMLLTGILTSTTGSCPISSKKVFVVGQSIEKAFQGTPKIPNPSKSNFLHVGRLDPSKNIKALIKTISDFRSLGFDFSLTLVGAPSKGNEKYFDQVKSVTLSMHDENWLKFVGTVTRNELPDVLRSFDFFIHAFIGSLDKSILEATYAGVPVVTLNPEYLAIFGSWGKSHPVTLKDEINAVFSQKSETIQEILRERIETVESLHSRKHWLDEVSKVLHGR